MSWKSSISISDDGANGTLSAVFTDADASTFSYSEIIPATPTARDACIQRAIVARNAWRTKKATNSTFATNVDSRFIQFDI